MRRYGGFSGIMPGFAGGLAGLAAVSGGFTASG
jgi:hypothetical protein